MCVCVCNFFLKLKVYPVYQRRFSLNTSVIWFNQKTPKYWDSGMKKRVHSKFYSVNTSSVQPIKKKTLALSIWCNSHFYLTHQETILGNNSQYGECKRGQQRCGKDGQQQATNLRPRPDARREECCLNSLESLPPLEITSQLHANDRNI